ncbi:MAG: hypothetical protein ABR511_03775 [Acidimicrobiales bacterium]
MGDDHLQGDPGRRQGGTRDSRGHDLAEAEANLAILISEELDTQHHLEGHLEPLPACPACRAHHVPGRGRRAS